MEANRKEIIEWLQSPEGEAWSHANVSGYNLFVCQRLVDSCGSEIYMPGMFGVRPG